jgi:hypothetical protein
MASDLRIFTLFNITKEKIRIIVKKNDFNCLKSMSKLDNPKAKGKFVMLPESEIFHGMHIHNLTFEIEHTTVKHSMLVPKYGITYNSHTQMYELVNIKYFDESYNHDIHNYRIFNFYVYEKEEVSIIRKEIFDRVKSLQKENSIVKCKYFMSLDAKEKDDNVYYPLMCESIRDCKSKVASFKNYGFICIDSEGYELIRV